MTAHRACPLCGADRPARWLEAELDGVAVPLVRCTTCAHRYRLHPRAASADGQMVALWSARRGWLRELVRRASARAKATYLTRALRRAPDRVLDVGCGDGLLLAALADRGWLATGVEPALPARRRARERGLTVAADLGDVERAPGFGLVVLWHVLEHAAEPRRLLAEAVARLAPGGHLVVVVPNAEARDRLWFGPRWVALDPRHHESHFDEPHLLEVLESAGLDPHPTTSWGGDLLFNCVLSVAPEPTPGALVRGALVALRLGLQPRRDRHGVLRTASILAIAGRGLQPP